MEREKLITVTTAQREEWIAQQIVMRETECAGYELNIENFQAIIDDPATPEDFRAECVERIKAEQRECNKVVAIMRALKKQLPAATLTASVRAAAVKMAGAPTPG